MHLSTKKKEMEELTTAQGFPDETGGGGGGEVCGEG